MEITIPASRVSNNVTATIRLTGMKPFRLRCFVGFWIIRVGAWVLPINTVIETE